MRKLTEVEEAKALMIQALEWSVVRWLRQKKRVRKTADRANEALDLLLQQTQARWTEEAVDAYRQLAEPGAPKNGSALNPSVQEFAKQMKRTHDEAVRARLAAEKTFDEAEKQLSTRLAREGCRQAVRSWDLHEKAIRKAETAVR